VSSGATSTHSTSAHDAPAHGTLARGADASGTGAEATFPVAARTAWRDRARGVAFGMASGAAFGLFFLFMRNGGETGALWPALAARSTGLVIYLAIAAVITAAPVTWRAGWPLFAAALGAGALDATANICYVLATRAGLFGPAVVLTALYPAVTVLLARIALRERMHRAQLAGLLLAAVGIALVAA
jgi:drug/metabolite transporter (DMT)-like permease